MASQEKIDLSAAMIAYSGLDEAFRALAGPGKEVTLKEAMMYAENTGTVSPNFTPCYKGGGEFAEGYEDMADWTIVAAENRNRPGESGFCGFIFETTDHERVVALRGSEAMADPVGTPDWVNDIDFLNTESTAQEKDLEMFLDENADILNEGNWRTTGHSLGGRLATHAAVYSAESHVLNRSKMINCTNFDGPGHSTEYIESHANAIDATSSKITHYRASGVGDLLIDLPGISTVYVESKGFKLANHSPKNWIGITDPDSDLIRREIEPWEEGIIHASGLIDRMPKPVGDAFSEYLKNVFIYAEYIKTGSKNFDIKKVPQYIADGLSTILTADPRELLEQAEEVVKTLAVALGTVVLVLTDIAVQYVEEAVLYLVEKASELICGAIDWLKDKVTDLRDAVMGFVDKVTGWFDRNRNEAAKYVKEHPYFKADPDSLYNYAARLNNVNRRLSRLDRDMRSLYRQVGFLDLWDILVANLLTAESYYLSRAQTYLMNTAERLKTAEDNAKNYLEG